MYHVMPHATDVTTPNSELPIRWSESITTNNHIIKNNSIIKSGKEGDILKQCENTLLL